jgi:hypothetical protein
MKANFFTILGVKTSKKKLAVFDPWGVPRPILLFDQCHMCQLSKQIAINAQVVE